MSKLKKKVFITIFSILTIVIFALFVFYNTRNYMRIYDDTSMVLNRVMQNQNRFFTDPDFMPNTTLPEMYNKPDLNKNNEVKNFMVLDRVVYTVLFDSNNNILSIYNNSANNEDIEDAKNSAIEILNSKSRKQQFIGNLFIDNYSYCFTSNFSLVIVDNYYSKAMLWNDLIYSLLIMLIFILISFFCSKYITKWITKPAEDSFEKQKNFIADASHELKTPLSVIIASSDALLQMPNEKKWIKNIQEESKRMNSLISNLLKLASTENASSFDFKLQNLSNIVELSVLTFEGRAFENNIKLNFKIQPDIMFVLDENSIKQLIEILLDNALKHTQDSHDINLKLIKENKQIVLEVVNYGEEIPKGHEKDIFERFYRADKSRGFKDNRFGLGLSIAKNIVEQHKGNISAFSKNKITTFKAVFKS